MLRPLALGLLTATVCWFVVKDADVGDLALEAATAGPSRLVPLPPDPGLDGPHAFVEQRRDGTGRPVLFDPCRPVQVSIRRDGELPGADALLDAALAEVARATGLDLIRVADAEGPIPDVAVAERRDDGGFPPALIAWSSEQERPDLAGPVVALGGATSWAPPGRVGEERLVGGLVLLDVEDLSALRAGADGEARLSGALLHELAHLVGLAHVDDPAQLLHASSAGTAFARGDLRGLHAAGQGQCFSDW